MDKRYLLVVNLILFRNSSLVGVGNKTNVIVMSIFSSRNWIIMVVDFFFLFGKRQEPKLFLFCFLVILYLIFGE